MKIYNEEQVIRAIHLAHSTNSINEVLADLTPIELPSDEEIEVERKRYGVHGVLFSDGAKWVKEQILPDDISKYKLESEQILNQNK